MPKLFDIKNGEIYVDERIVLRQNSTPQELVTAGLVFSREIEMKTGWVFRVTGPHQLSGRSANLSLGFLNGSLKTVSFAFAEKAIANLDDLHKMQNQVLIQELGTPDGQNDRQIIYRFPWGEIVSETDTRGGSCNIVISWM
ncbi:MAG: hypothetical protein P4L91_05765 [Burkholderiaceae bacterium]|nr:hypothetical protein [Burkholderiaceae bacterium]